MRICCIAQGTLLNILQWPIYGGGEGHWLYLHVKLTHFVVHLKQTQHCKSTKLQ